MIDIVAILKSFPLLQLVKSVASGLDFIAELCLDLAEIFCRIVLLTVALGGIILQKRALGVVNAASISVGVVATPRNVAVVFEFGGVGLQVEGGNGRVFAVVSHVHNLNFDFKILIIKMYI
jgi:hypothetical protein